MKIRTGFVSNSSSSSFVCKNDKLTVEMVKQKMKNMVRFYNDFFKDAKLEYQTTVVWSIY